MRRKDFECQDKILAFKILDELQDGTLATLNKLGAPTLRPMNYVRIDDVIYFHGASKGERSQGLNQLAVFNAYRTLAIIPSYWSDPVNACPATTLFESISIKGTLEIENNPEVKALALQKFMQKLQPEGKHLSISQNLNYYRQEIDRVAVFKLPITELSFKLKTGQNWNDEKRKVIEKLLRQRAQGFDILASNYISGVCK